MAAHFDLVIRGGQVVDGSGAPGYTADIGIRGGHIAKIGRVTEMADRVIDADGLTVTPGFIDIHTHYDAQLFFEPTASPSSWHGVTTVFSGNCGFTFAPAKPADVPWLLQMLSRVEGMSPEALSAGVSFSGGSFADFLRALDGRIGVNLSANVGHCAVRRWVMGEEASHRRATNDEIGAMRNLVWQALTDGATGFTSSQLSLHVDHEGSPVPSNVASPEEITHLAGALAGFRGGAIEFIPESFATGYSDKDRRLVLAMCRSSAKPVHLNTVTRLPHQPEGWRRALGFALEAARSGGQVHPMFSTNRFDGLHFSLATTFLFDEMPTFRSVLTRPSPERERLLGDSVIRDRLRSELSDTTGRSVTFSWDSVRVSRVRDEAHTGWVGRTLVDLAREMGVDPFDAMLELSIAEDCRTDFVQARPTDVFAAQEARAATEELIRSRVCMAGSSDGGAHILSFCGVDFPTRLLTEWVPDVLSFEEAVSRLTSVPAAVHGIADRGVLRVGAAADLLLIDRQQLGVGDTRFVSDFPAGTGRLVIDAIGYRTSIVNGKVLLEDGVHTGVLPGQILRR
jgi:N-acyl-D-aspartate/D-glutamate deacylase